MAAGVTEPEAERGAPPKVALVAAMRKRLAIPRNAKPWQAA